MKNFLISQFTRIATYATIIVIFTHNALFDREVACTCKDQKVHCNVYISVPIFIIFLLLLWYDKNFNGTCRAYCCMKTRRMSGTKCCHIIFLQMVKALVIGLLWVVSVLFDGDWYACCRNGLSKNDTQIPCKKKRTPEEQATIDNLKNESKIIGLGALLGLLFLVVCYSLLKWWDWCYSLQNCWDWCRKKCCDCCREDICKCSKKKWCGCCRKDGCKCSRKDGSCKCSKKKWWDCCREDICTCSKKKWWDCCMEKWYHCCMKWSGYINEDGLYELIIIKEEENIVNDILKERAKETLTEKVNKILKENETKEYMDGYELPQKVINQLRPEGNQENIEGTSGDEQGGIRLNHINTPSSQHHEAPSTSGGRSRTSSTDPLLVQVETRAEPHQPTRRCNIL